MGRIATLFILGILWIPLGCTGGQGSISEEERSSSSEATSEEASNSQTPPPPSDVTSQPANAVTSENEPAVINLPGNGPTATDPFDLESGLAIFRMPYEGERNFIVRLLGEPGAQADGVLLANAIGSFTGSQAAKTEAGQHLLDIQASGPWTITIEQPRPTSAPQTGHYTYNVGKAATDFFQLRKGPKKFTMTHQGEKNFTVWLLDKNGERVNGGLLANEIGAFDGSRSIQV
jgi:hypothetical protein